MYFFPPAQERNAFCSSPEEKLQGTVLLWYLIPFPSAGLWE